MSVSYRHQQSASWSRFLLIMLVLTAFTTGLVFNSQVAAIGSALYQSAIGRWEPALQPGLTTGATATPTADSMPTLTPGPRRAHAAPEALAVASGATPVPTEPTPTETPVEPSATPPPSETPVEPSATPPPTTTPAGPVKTIIVDLSDQWLYAYEDDSEVHAAPVSTGRDGFNTPPGTFAIYAKLPLQTMRGTLNGESWVVPDVPHVMYFYGDVALHGAYWHNRFGSGERLSHGCVNLPLESAAWFYEWAPLGTTVIVQW